MKRSGLIYTRNGEKLKPLLKRKTSPAWGIKIVFLLIMIALFWSKQTRLAGSANSRNKNILDRLVQLAISSTPTPSPTATATPTPTPTPVILPSRLIVDKLGIDAEIEYVGVDDNGKMGVPSNWDNVAWYRAGPVPGQTGNVVIAGHFDTNRGKPAVFYHLESLEPGDIIRVSKVDGSLFDYRVTRREIFPYNEVPVDYIFRSQEGSQLVLITCNGYFNRGIQSYSHRIAIFSEML